MTTLQEQAERNSSEHDGSRWKLLPVVKWGQVIGNEECPYMRRWLIQNRWGTVRVHHFLSSDDDRAMHDHPWWFITFMLKGSYVDVSKCTECYDGKTEPMWWDCRICDGTGIIRDRLRVGSIRFRRATHIHRVESTGSWTFVISGPWQRHWGFWSKGTFQRWKAYLADKGFAPCQD